MECSIIILRIKTIIKDLKWPKEDFPAWSIVNTEGAQVTLKLTKENPLTPLAPTAMNIHIADKRTSVH